MSDLNIGKEHNGYVYTIKNIEHTYVACNSKCFYIKDKDYSCSKKETYRKLGIASNPDDMGFNCIKITVNVKNVTASSDWYIDANDMFVIDNHGYQIAGSILCENCLPPMIARERTQVIPHTQLDYIQIFPCLSEKDTISKVMINIYNRWTDFVISEEMNDLDSLCQKLQINKEHNGDTNNESNSQLTYIGSDIIAISSQIEDEKDSQLNWQLEKINERITKLKTMTFSRLNNILSTPEKVKIENRIENEFYSIELELKSKSHIDKKFLDKEEELLEIKCNFKKSLSMQNQIDDKRKSLSQKIDELLELSPREFEEYVTELISHLGYSDVELTPYVNDKGIDIIAYKDSIKYGIQCKRYKGTVGSPEVQTFLGALNHAKADKGLFITTGMFSFEAEKMAAEHPIELINRIDLVNLIIQAINHD